MVVKDAVVVSCGELVLATTTFRARQAMSFIQTFVNGEQGAFKPETLTPMQKMTLRFVVVGLVYYAFAVIEGMIMRIYEVDADPGRAAATSSSPS